MSTPQLSIWAVLILFGAVQGLVLAFVFWSKTKKAPANTYFGWLLFSIALHLLEYTLSISGFIFEVPHLMFSTYPLLFVIAPLFYLYVRRYLFSGALQWRQVLPHFLPALFLFLLLLPFYLQNGQQKIEFFLMAAQNNFGELPNEQSGC